MPKTAPAKTTAAKATAKAPDKTAPAKATGTKTKVSIMAQVGTMPPIAYLETNKIFAHPLNPRPWSETYQCHVHDSKVAELVASITNEGYDLLEPIQVRQIGETFEIIAGHHRYCAMSALKHEKVPCVILDIGPIEAVMRLVNRQGKELDPWGLANHAYMVCEVEKICNQGTYAKKTSNQSTLISKWVRACVVLEEIGKKYSINNRVNVTTAATVHRLPKETWKETIDLILKEEMPTRGVEALVNARLGKTTTADKKTPVLPEIVDPSVLTGDDSGEETITETTTQTDKVVSQVAVEKTKAIKSNIPVGLHKPIGIQANMLTWKPEAGTNFQLVILDHSGTREDLDIVLEKINEVLATDGRLIIISEPTHTHWVIEDAEANDIELEQKLIWFKGANNKDALESRMWPSSYKEILIFRPVDGMGYFAADECCKHFEIAPADVLKIGASIDGNISNTLAEIIYRTYCPPAGRILIPAVMEAQIINAATRLNHKVTWLEPNETLFQKIEGTIS
jgi:ParB family transcriptional regulator, chromosome partitioning protein